MLPEPVDSTSRQRSRHAAQSCMQRGPDARVTAMKVQVFVEYHPDEVDGYIKIADRIEDAFPGLQVEGVEDAGMEQGVLVLKAQDQELLRMAADKVPARQRLVDVMEKAGYTAG